MCRRTGFTVEDVAVLNLDFVVGNHIGFCFILAGVSVLAAHQSQHRKQHKDTSFSPLSGTDTFPFGETAHEMRQGAEADRLCDIRNRHLRMASQDLGSHFQAEFI